MAKLTQEDILAYLDEATILELNELVKAAAPVAAAAPTEAAAAAPTTVNVVLAAAGDSKVGVIKVVREITGLGLVDAKKLVDGAPATIKENVAAEEAEELKKKLTDAGATVEFK